MSENKIVQFETIPQLKLGFAGIGLDEIDVINKYIDDNIDDFQSYSRKSFAHTGSFVSVSTASFTATSASAPSGYTATSEDDFMFFANGMIMEHDALNIQQSGSEFYLKVNSNSIGYDLKSSDEFVVWGKFNS